MRVSRFYVDDGVGTMELQTGSHTPDGLAHLPFAGVSGLLPDPYPIDDLPWWPYGDGAMPNGIEDGFLPGALYFQFAAAVAGPDDPLPGGDLGSALIDLPLNEADGNLQIRWRCTPALPNGSWGARFRDGGLVVQIAYNYYRSLQPVTLAEYRVTEIEAENFLEFNAFGARVRLNMLASTVTVDVWNGVAYVTGMLTMPDYSDWCVLNIDRSGNDLAVSMWEGDLDEGGDVPDLTFTAAPGSFPVAQKLSIFANATGVDETWKLELDIVTLDTSDTDVPIGDQECDPGGC